MGTTTTISLRTILCINSSSFSIVFEGWRPLLQTVKDFSYDICKSDRICLSGANGVGKTTFVNVLTGQQPADSEEIGVGNTIVLGLYEQLGIPGGGGSGGGIPFLLPPPTLLPLPALLMPRAHLQNTILW